jgi:presenilin-like A22 family membrane protease
LDAMDTAIPGIEIRLNPTNPTNYILYFHLMTEAEAGSETLCILTIKRRKISENMYQFNLLLLLFSFFFFFLLLLLSSCTVVLVLGCNWPYLAVVRNVNK